VQVRFDPQQLGPKEASLHITYSDGGVVVDQSVRV